MLAPVTAAKMIRHLKHNSSTTSEHYCSFPQKCGCGYNGLTKSYNLARYQMQVLHQGGRGKTPLTTACAEGTSLVFQLGSRREEVSLWAHCRQRRVCFWRRTLEAVRVALGLAVYGMGGGGRATVALTPDTLNNDNYSAIDS